MTITDFIILIVSILCLARGAERGFMRSLMIPVSLIIATIISVLYYQITQDLIVSLLIGLLGPILLHYLLKFLLKIFAKATNTDVGPGTLSSLAGAVLTLVWGWVFIVLTLTLLALFPAKKEPLITLRNDVTGSIAYKNIAPWVEKLLPLSKEKSDVQSLSQDPRFQKILQDAEIRQEINDHDMSKLMRNPKIMALTQQIINDPQMLKKVLAAWKNQANGPSSP